MLINSVLIKKKMCIGLPESPITLLEFPIGLRECPIKLPEFPVGLVESLIGLQVIDRTP